MYYYRLISSMLKAVISTLGTGLYAVYKATSILTTLNTSIFRVYNGDNVNDTSGNAQNGTNVGGVTFTSGKIGNAFTFNGSNYISLPDNSMNLTGDFSISCWVNMTSVAGVQVFLSTYQTIGGVEYGFWFRVINSFQFTVYNGPTRIDTNPSGGAISTNTWYHVVVTKTSSQIKWYINGVADNVFNGTYNIPYHPTSNIAAIGALYKWNGTDTVQYMSNGSKIDALTVWNKVLTGSEVTALYNGASGLEYPFSTAITIDSANDSLGTYNGTPYGGLTYTAGKSGNAFTFNGTSAYISLPTNTLSSLTDFSISFWYNPSSLPGGSALVGNYTWIGGIDRGYLFYLNYGTLYFRLWGSSTVDLVASGTFSTNTWYHVVLTRKESTRSKIYINGSLNASNTSTVNPNYTTTNYNSLGASQYNATNKEYYCDGKMDEVNIWSKELTATEVTELYNAGAGKFYPY